MHVVAFITSQEAKTETKRLHTKILQVSVSKIPNSIQSSICDNPTVEIIEQYDPTMNNTHRVLPQKKDDTNSPTAPFFWASQKTIRSNYCQYAPIRKMPLMRQKRQRLNQSAYSTKTSLVTCFWRYVIYSIGILVILGLLIPRMSSFPTNFNAIDRELLSISSSIADVVGGEGGQEGATSATATMMKEQQHNENMLGCLHNVLTKYLPVGYGRPQLRSKKLTIFAHHWDAGNHKIWNAGMRVSKHIKELNDANDRAAAESAGGGAATASNECNVWEVGAHKTASDSHDLIRHYPNCKFHAFEPIPKYYTYLKEHIAGNSKQLVRDNIIPYNYGLGSTNTSFLVSPESLQQQSTYIGDSIVGGGNNNEENGDTNNMMTAYIKTFDFAIQDTGGKKPTMLHMNCEGCEWDMIPQAISSGFISNIPIIQIATHNYGSVGLGSRAYEYCTIQSLLNQTHKMVNDENYGTGIPFAWERWVLRDTS